MTEQDNKKLSPPNDTGENNGKADAAAEGTPSDDAELEPNAEL